MIIISDMCKTFIFSSHAIQRMFERAISKEVALTAVQTGEIIAKYPDDKPYPSYLFFARIKGRPIHAVCAIDSSAELCYIITVYEPDPKLWKEDFKTRRT